MNILVIFTGGTIGSSIKDGYISPDMDKKYKLIQMYREHSGDMTDFDVDVPYITLSENLNGEHITKLIHCIQKHIEEEKYDGIIITHGTDTLHYTAAALSVIFENVNIPLMVVSSNYPLEDERANGLYNFIAAVDYIKQKSKAGVYVPYKNRNQHTKIFNPKYMANYDVYSDEIRGVNVEEKSEDEKAEMFKHCKVNPSTVDLKEKSPVKFIRPYPGIRYEMPDDEIKAILFATYHSGTINTADKSLVEFCSKMNTANIPMYICTVPQGIGYESTKCYEELGIKVLPIGTDIYWYMKLWLNNI